MRTGKPGKHIIDLSLLNHLNADGCPSCGHNFTLGDPVVEACGAWEGGPRLIHDHEAVFDRYAEAASAAQEYGLGVNAGHDLNLDNLSDFIRIPGILEVSIGHALISDALRYGLEETVRRYLACIHD